MIREAVILAGGMGTRISEFCGEVPKGFIRIDGEVPIVEQSVRKLFAAGMERIVIGTGYHREYYDELASRYSGVETVFNPDFASTGSMGTLEVAAGHVSGDILLLESDLIYDRIGLHILLQHPGKNVILASGRTGSGDEVYIEADARKELVMLSKQPALLKRIDGELVGITRISRGVLTSMCRYAAEFHGSGKRMEYEEALTAVAAEQPVLVHTVEHYLWREIDDASHFRMARDIIMPQIREAEANSAVAREILLNPGPATTTDSVKYAQVVPDICPRTEEFSEVMRYVARELTGFAADPEAFTTVLFGGSGTAADEAMIASCIGDRDRLLILDNGVYGDRMARIAEVYRLPFERLKSSPWLPVDPEALERQLATGRFTHLAYVFHETTTGVLNPAKEIGALCRKYRVAVLADAVSAFAGIPFDLEECGIDFMAATSNKNLQGIAGIAFVICRKECLPELKHKTKRSCYLDLYDQYDYFARHGQTRFTPPVQAFYALRQAIIELKNEGVEARHRRYCACWSILTAAAAGLGLEMPVPLAHQSRLITAFREPDCAAYDFNEMYEFFRSRGFTVYPGKAADLPTFRIANIGDIRPDEMTRFAGLLTDYFSGKVMYEKRSRR
ncbi:MAG: 2-aminoethylphosphonate--pyruvate transaminase [Lentisphaeria bacterium]|nr:2-aminoethylphosphonate--pyruvate transaminase [Lentisphaeria bacterium]